MRCRFLIAAIVLAATGAHADSNSKIGWLDEEVVAPACRHYEKLPDGTSQRPMLAAKISIASCTATIRIRGAQRTLVSEGPAIRALDDAARPALAMLDDVITAGDPAMSIIAQSVKADIYVGMAVRVRNTVPPITATTVGATLAALDQRHTDLEPKLRPWLDHATAAYQAVAALAATHPELGHDPVIQTAVRESDAALEAGPAACPAPT